MGDPRPRTLSSRALPGHAPPPPPPRRPRPRPPPAAAAGFGPAPVGLVGLETAVPLTLDGLVADLKLERLDFIKLDVDGAECDVLAGGRDTLARLRPLILFEFSPYALEERGCDAPTLLGTLREHGYSFQDERGATSLDPSVLVRRTPRYGSINLLAVPQA